MAVAMPVVWAADLYNAKLVLAPKKWKPSTDSKNWDSRNNFASALSSHATAMKNLLQISCLSKVEPWVVKTPNYRQLWQSLQECTNRPNMRSASRQKKRQSQLKKANLLHRRTLLPTLKWSNPSLKKQSMSRAKRRLRQRSLNQRKMRTNLLLSESNW